MDLLPTLAQPRHALERLLGVRSDARDEQAMGARRWGLDGVVDEVAGVRTTRVATGLESVLVLPHITRSVYVRGFILHETECRLLIVYNRTITVGDADDVRSDDEGDDEPNKEE